MDIRVIDLVKVSDGEKLYSIPPGGSTVNAESYICLGHFDNIEIRCLPHPRQSEQFFSEIWGDFCDQPHVTNSKRHIYPLYILHEDLGERMENFWKHRFPCVVVSRVHGAMLQDTNEELLSSIIMRNTRVYTGKNAFGDLTVMPNGKDIVHCAFYHTLELGDIAVVIKGDSLNACLQIPRILMKDRSIGDVYSYCGLHQALFVYNNTPQQLTDFANYMNGKTQEGLTQTIPYISMRFSVRGADFANQLWDILEIKSRVHFVTGTADALIEYRDIDEENSKTALDIVDMIVQLDSIHRDRNSTDRWFSRYDAFNDIITRVGIPFANALTQTQPSHLLDIEDQNALLTKIEDIRDVICTQNVCSNGYYDHDWMIALSAQTRLLLTLMNNCVMDDLSLLIWPGAKAFIDRIWDMIVNKQIVLDVSQIEEIEVFLNGWSTLSNDIIHLESQLVQNPKLQNPRVYIPTSLLVFYMAFLNKIGNVLMIMDESEAQNGATESTISRRHYYPLIAHNIGKRTSTICILDPSKVNDDLYQGACPLLVSLPVSLMYSPEEIAVVLCHEYAHYAGDTVRLRTERFKRLLYTSAGLLLNMWHLDSSAPPIITIPLLQEHEVDYITLIANEAENAINSVDPQAFKYIHKLRAILPTVIANFFADRDLMGKVLHEYCDRNVLNKRFPQYMEQFTSQNQVKSIKTIHTHLDDILILYHECYADIVAGIFLSLDRNAFLNSIFRREVLIVSKKNELDDRLKRLAFQAALDCVALGWDDLNLVSEREETSARERTQYNHNYEQWKQQVNTFIDCMRKNGHIHFDAGEDKIGLLFAIPEMYSPLLAYLQRCAIALKKTIENQPVINARIQELKKMYNMISNDFRLTEFRAVINQYQNEVRSLLN